MLRPVSGWIITGDIKLFHNPRDSLPFLSRGNASFLTFDVMKTLEATVKLFPAVEASAYLRHHCCYRAPLSGCLLCFECNPQRVTCWNLGLSRSICDGTFKKQDFRGHHWGNAFRKDWSSSHKTLVNSVGKSTLHEQVWMLPVHIWSLPVHTWSLPVSHMVISSLTIWSLPVSHMVTSCLSIWSLPVSHMVTFCLSIWSLPVLPYGHFLSHHMVTSCLTYSGTVTSCLTCGLFLSHHMVTSCLRRDHFLSQLWPPSPHTYTGMPRCPPALTHALELL